MPKESEPLFTKFPSGGGLYRIHWIGRYIQSKADTETPRVGVWLNQMIPDESGKYRPEHSRLQQDKLLLCFLDESVGSIPSLAIDTYWRDGQQVMPSFALNDGEDFELLPPQTWQVNSASEPIEPSSRKTWIGRAEYPLFGLNEAGQTQLLYTAPVVTARTTSGKTLVIPTYEIYRCYFAASSELAIALLRDPFQRAREKLVNLDATQLNSEGEFEIELSKGLPEVTARYLSLFLGTDYGMKAASGIHAAIKRQGDTHPQYMPWIEARPPFPNEPVSLRVIGKWLNGQDRFLVYRIVRSTFPALPFSIRQIVDKQYIPIEVEPDQTKEGRKDGEGERNKTHSTGLLIAPAGDAKQGRRPLHIDSIAVAWAPTSLPKIKRVARERKFFPKPPEPQQTGKSTPVEREVSVGAKSTKSRQPRASISGEAIEQIVSRFEALHQCLASLKTQNEISEWCDYALVRPEVVVDRTYCALIDIEEIFPHPWAVVFSPAKRSRLAWVGQIKRNGKTVYWLDIEPRSKKDSYFALVFTVKEAPLKESVLSRLFNLCVSKDGRWPQYSAFGLQDAVTWVRGKHTMAGAIHSPTAVLSAIDRVLRLSEGGLPQPAATQNA